MYTCVLLQVLKQAAQLLRPGGKLVLLQHGRSDWEWWNSSLDENAEQHKHKWGCWWNRDILVRVHCAGGSAWGVF